MEINNTNINDNLNFNSNQTDNHIINSYIKDFKSLIVGDMFRAIVSDIGVNNIVLKFENGQVLNAKSLILPNSRIGDTAIFIVTENIKGQILLEMLNNNSDNLKFGIITEALDNAEMIATKENFQLVNTLIENNISVDKKTLHSAAFFKYFGEGLKDKEIVFLLDEKISATEKNINIFKHINSNENNVLKNSEEIIEELVKLIINKSSETVNDYVRNNKIDTGMKDYQIKELLKEFFLLL